MAIDIGAVAINRAADISISAQTVVSKENPANASGTIDTVEISLNSRTGSNDVWAGTFSAAGNVLTCRDSESIGDIGVGSKTTVSGLDIDVETGDYLGTHDRSAATVRIESATSGDGVWVFVVEAIDPSDSETFTFVDNRTQSLFGTGTEAAAGRSYGFVIG